MSTPPTVSVDCRRPSCCLTADVIATICSFLGRRCLLREPHTTDIEAASECSRNRLVATLPTTDSGHVVVETTVVGNEEASWRLRCSFIAPVALSLVNRRWRRGVQVYDALADCETHLEVPRTLLTAVNASAATSSTTPFGCLQRDDDVDWKAAGGFPVVVTMRYSVPVAISGYAIKLASDAPHRDPTSWLVSVLLDDGERLDVHRVRAAELDQRSHRCTWWPYMGAIRAEDGQPLRHCREVVFTFLRARLSFSPEMHLSQIAVFGIAAAVRGIDPS